MRLSSGGSIGLSGVMNKLLVELFIVIYRIGHWAVFKDIHRHFMKAFDSGRLDI